MYQILTPNDQINEKQVQYFLDLVAQNISNHSTLEKIVGACIAITAPINDRRTMSSLIDSAKAGVVAVSKQVDLTHFQSIIQLLYNKYGNQAVGLQQDFYSAMLISESAELNRARDTDGKANYTKIVCNAVVTLLNTIQTGGDIE